ncbi:MAG: uracil-DNA glycosylase [Pseudobdellovibrionaceae bacterium]
MTKNEVRLNKSWKAHIGDQFENPKMQNLKKFLQEEYKKGKTIFPKGPEYFAALEHTPFEKVKVVILGQDPYHGPGQAHGLSFSVRKGIPLPPSLLNIFKELKNDLGIFISKHGFLESWADQGVLLLNAVLTVEQSRAASHQGKGWEEFTDRIIRELNDKRDGIVFILWGSYAQKKGSFIDRKRHLVIESPHPSPLSSHRGFFGSKPFSKANEYLKSHSQKPINWELPQDS